MSVVRSRLRRYNHHDASQMNHVLQQMQTYADECSKKLSNINTELDKSAQAFVNQLAAKYIKANYLSEVSNTEFITFCKVFSASGKFFMVRSWKDGHKNKLFLIHRSGLGINLDPAASGEDVLDLFYDHPTTYPEYVLPTSDMVKQLVPAYNKLKALNVTIPMIKNHVEYVLEDFRTIPPILWESQQPITNGGRRQCAKK